MQAKEYKTGGSHREIQNHKRRLTRDLKTIVSWKERTKVGLGYLAPDLTQNIWNKKPEPQPSQRQGRQAHYEDQGFATSKRMGFLAVPVVTRPLERRI